MKNLSRFAAVLALALCASLAFAAEETVADPNEKSLISIIIETLVGVDADEGSGQINNECGCGTLPGG